MKLLWMLKRLGILLMIPVLVSCARPIPVQAADAPPPASATVDNKMNNDILYYINEHRNKIGLGSLRMLDAAMVQAYIHSRNMATGKAAFGHSGYEQRVAAVKKSTGPIRASAENVAYGNLSAREVVKGWLNSPRHRKNIEGNYEFTGIGVYRSRNGDLYFTQLFLRK